MARVELRCIMGSPGLKSSYQEKGLLKDFCETYKFYEVVFNFTFKLYFGFDFCITCFMFQLT